MKQFRSEIKCECKKEFSMKKKQKSENRSQGRPLRYPDCKKFPSKTFHIKYERKLSSIAKFLLNSFRQKYFYYAMDDILYLLKSNPSERDNLLAILESPILSVHNTFSINFFDIWISEIYISEVSKVNRFLTHNGQNFEPFSYITIKLLYGPKRAIKKQETLW